MTDTTPQPTHALFRPSAAERWINCPGSIPLTKDLPQQETSVFAEEGKKAHDLAELILTGKEYDVKDYDLEMIDYVNEYVDYVKSIPGHMFCEVKVDFSTYVPEGYGTSDSVIYDAEKRILHVVDLKYGKGVQVYADKNKQLMLYALGAYESFKLLYEIESVILHVVQPRLKHFDYYALSTQELLKFAGVAQEAAQIALNETKEPVLNPGESQCRWCEAKQFCKARADYLLKEAQVEFNEPDEPKLGYKEWELTPQRLAQLLPVVNDLIDWATGVKAYAQEQAINGLEIPGYKLVQGKSKREWLNEEETVKVLTELLKDPKSFYETKLLSPAKVEKKLTKDDRPKIKDLIDKKYNKPQLVPESDKKPALNTLSTAKNDFD